jgi:hypothetical protein
MLNISLEPTDLFTRIGGSYEKVLIACEYSGSVRDEFLKLGFDAHSCDLLPCESKYDSNPDRHHQGDILEVLNQDWDLMIAHPLVLI